jgi:hypothetical protein
MRIFLATLTYIGMSVGVAILCLALSGCVIEPVHGGYYGGHPYHHGYY